MPPDKVTSASATATNWLEGYNVHVVHGRNSYTDLCFHALALWTDHGRKSRQVVAEWRSERLALSWAPGILQ
jgi:hypothetical protein